MKQTYRYDADGVYKEPVILEDNEPIPENCTVIQPPDGLFKAKYVNGQWVERLSQEEINALKTTPQPLSPIEQLQKDQADLMFQLMLKGVI